MLVEERDNLGLVLRSQLLRKIGHQVAPQLVNGASLRIPRSPFVRTERLELPLADDFRVRAVLAVIQAEALKTIDIRSRLGAVFNPRAGRQVTIDRETVALTALWVAWLRKRRTMSAKGRQVTDRVFQQWKNKHAASDLSAVIREAEQRAGGIDASDESWAEALQPHLALMLCCEEQRRPGRPRKRLKPAPGSLVHAALMERGAVAADIGGRPRTISPDEDRRMLAFLLGTKLALYADNELYPRSDSIQKILQNFPEGWRSIDDAVPDARAFSRVKDSEQFRPYRGMTFDAMRMRLKRAKSDFSLDIAKIKSGGSC